MNYMGVLRFITILLTFIVSGCAWFSEKSEPITPAAMYERAHEMIDSADLEGGISKLEELIATYPQGKYAQQALIDIAYTYYVDKKYSEALVACDRFIREHPNHPQLEYVHYLKGLSHFRDDRGILDYIGQQNPSERDRKSMLYAYNEFKTLVENFPSSPYQEDALKRMKFLINRLAEHEIAVSRYYLRRGAYSAAINRAKKTLNTYPDSSSGMVALAILMASYKEMGLEQPMKEASEMLAHNFPNSDLHDAVVKTGADGLLSLISPSNSRKAFYESWFNSTE